MNTLRLICTEVESGAACHIGGPAVVTYKTFDVPCPPDLAEWLEKRGAYLERFISGTEVIDTALTQPAATEGETK